MSVFCLRLGIGGQRLDQDPNPAGAEGSSGAHGSGWFLIYRHILQHELFVLGETREVTPRGMLAGTRG